MVKLSVKAQEERKEQEEQEREVAQRKDLPQPAQSTAINIVKRNSTHSRYASTSRLRQRPTTSAACSTHTRYPFISLPTRDSRPGPGIAQGWSVPLIWQVPCPVLTIRRGQACSLLLSVDRSPIVFRRVQDFNGNATLLRLDNVYSRAVRGLVKGLDGRIPIRFALHFLCDVGC